MIKIKKSEFIKFLKTINEMRSSYSRSFIENEGEEDFTPIDATDTMGANQLAHALPPVEDPDFEPGSTETLRGAMMKIANEVPNSQIETFYRDLLKLFDETIDKMPEGENPFNPVTESVVRMLVEMSDEEADKEEETVEDEISGEPFNFDTAGPGVYIDLSHVEGAESLISDMNNRQKQEDSGHIDTTVFEVEQCIESEIFKQLFSSNESFKRSFANEVDLEVMSSGLDSIESLDYSNPVLQSSEALENLMGSLGKAFLLAKLTVFEKIFGEKRSKDDIKMSAEVMADKPSIRKILSYDQAIPASLHEFAIVSGYMTNTIDLEEAKKLMYDGFASLFGNESERFMRVYIKKYQKEIENGQLEVLLPKEKKIDMSQFGDYGAFDEDSKTFAVDPNVRKLFNYITLVKGGEKEDIANAAAFLYFTVARASYFMEKNRQANMPAPSTATQAPSGKRKRVRLNPGSIFKGTLIKVDPQSNIVKELIKNIVEEYIDTLPDKQTQSDFLTTMVDLIVDENGNITEERSLELGKDIIKTSLMGKDLSSLTVHESTIYSNCYYQISEILRMLRLKIKTSFQDTGKPIYNPEESPFEWRFLEDDQRRSVNSMLNGIDLEIVDVVYRYIGQMVESNEDVLKILNRSSKESGGNFTIDVPVVTFAYIAPFILANIWQKTLTDHWERYKPSKKIASVNIDPESEIQKIEKYFSDKSNNWSEIGPFIGFKSPAGAKQYYEQQVAYRFAFLDRHFDGNYPTESGAFHTKMIETIYDRISPFLNDGLENYLKLLEKARDDENLGQEEREYYSDIFQLYTEYSSQMNEINDIVMDFNVFDVEGMDMQDWIFDDEEELIPTDVRAKFNRLLRETIPGKALRLLSHDLTISYPNKAESFMSDITKWTQHVTQDIIAADNEISLEGTQKYSQRQKFAGNFVEYFSGKRPMPDFSNPNGIAKSLVDAGFTYDKFLECLRKTSRFVDKVFAHIMQSESAKDISFSEFGNEVEDYVSKNILKSSMHNMVQKRLESLESSLEAFNNPNNMERVTNIIDNYFLDAYDETQLENLYDKFSNVVTEVKEEFAEEIVAIKAIDNPKKKKSAMDKLVKKITREVSKRKKPIQKDALTISTEMKKRRAYNAKRQGKLLWD